MIVAVAEYLAFTPLLLCQRLGFRDCHVTARRRERERKLWLPHIADSEGSARASRSIVDSFNSVLPELESMCGCELRRVNCWYFCSVSLQETEKDKASLVIPPWWIIYWCFFPPLLLLFTTRTAMSIRTRKGSDGSRSHRNNSSTHPVLRSFNVGYLCLPWIVSFVLVIIYVCVRTWTVSTFKIGLYRDKCAFKSLSVICVIGESVIHGENGGSLTPVLINQAERLNRVQLSHARLAPIWCSGPSAVCSGLALSLIPGECFAHAWSGVKWNLPQGGICPTCFTRRCLVILCWVLSSSVVLAELPSGKVRI